MAIDPSDKSIVRKGPSQSALILQSEALIKDLFDELIMIGKLELNEDEKEITFLKHCIITFGKYLAFFGYCWPKPNDLFGIVFVEILELGEKIWPLREYFSINEFPETEKLVRIAGEFERENDPERTALATDTEPECIATESDEKAIEFWRLHTKLNWQLGAIKYLTEKQLREIQSRGFEIIREMIDPSSTDRNPTEPNPPKLPKAQPRLTNQIVPYVSEDDFSPFNYATRWVEEGDDGLPIVAIHKTTLKGLEDQLRHLYAVYQSFEPDIERASVYRKSYHVIEREIDLKRQRLRLLQIRGFDSLRTYANSQFTSPITIRVLREIYSTLTDKLGVTLSLVEDMDLEQAFAYLTTPPALAAGKPIAEPVAPAVNSEQPPVVATPSTQFIPLTGWNEILAALNEPHGKAVVWKLTQQTRDKIRKLNETHCGPVALSISQA